MAETIWLKDRSADRERQRPADGTGAGVAEASFQGAALARTTAGGAITVPVVSGLVVVWDALVVLATSYVVYVAWLTQDPYSTWAEYAVVTTLGTLLAVNAFHLARLYDFNMLSRPRLAMRRLAIAWGGVAVALIVLSYLTKTSIEYSRLWAVAWFGITFAALVSSRFAIRSAISRWAVDGVLCNHIAVIGTPAAADRLARRLAAMGDPCVRVVGCFDDAGEGDGLRALEQRIRNHQVDTVVVALPWSEEERILRVLGRLRECPVDVLLGPTGIGLSLTRSQVRYIGAIPTLSVLNRPLSGWRYIAKEIEDRVLASLILVLIAPIMLAIAIAVKLDSPGPVLFRQKRQGFNNRPIEVWKFRTMYHDQADPEGRQLTRRNDPRVTRLGRFLRRTSLDELPQFFNVLRGEMSIVGPRPHATTAKAAGQLYQDAVRQYAARHRVKPGITGWAQVNGWRGETETLEQIRRRVDHDIAYIEDWSVWLDIKIILLTVLRVFHDRHAF